MRGVAAEGTPPRLEKGVALLLLGSTSSLPSSGTAKASVLPLPVGACNTASRPPKISSNDFDWTGRSDDTPRLTRAEASSGHGRSPGVSGGRRCSPRPSSSVRPTRSADASDGLSSSRSKSRSREMDGGAFLSPAPDSSIPSMPSAQVSAPHSLLECRDSSSVAAESPRPSKSRPIRRSIRSDLRPDTRSPLDRSASFSSGTVREPKSSALFEDRSGRETPWADGGEEDTGDRTVLSGRWSVPPPSHRFAFTPGSTVHLRLALEMSGGAEGQARVFHCARKAVAGEKETADCSTAAVARKRYRSCQDRRLQHRLVIDALFLADDGIIGFRYACCCVIINPFLGPTSEASSILV
mmetsp:Transcript_3782/g.10183  ORF Transcript_3782/g.10183 Transcript_3782/m.10183 type:complete len:353 (-) Transcript_3782:4-1062(-)